MKVRRTLPHGYTVVEVMIFLMFSGGLFVMAAIMLSGQQRKTEFAQASRDIESQIQDYINDVATGYYPRSADFTCTTSTSGIPEIGPGSGVERGKNTACIFIGKVMHFGVYNADPDAAENLNLYTVVGRRVRPDGKQVSDFEDAKVEMIDPNTNKEEKALSYGLKVKKMRYGIVNPAGVTVWSTIGAVGIFSSFGAYSGGSLVSGAQTVNLVPIKATDIGWEPADIRSAVRYPATSNATQAIINPSGGVTICFESGGTKQLAIVSLGGSGRQLSTKLDIVDTAPTSGPLAGACS